MLADLRRRARTEQSLTTRIPILVKEDAAPSFRFQVKKATAVSSQAPSPRQTSELTAIKRDLSKTFILAAVAIAAEIVIYLFRR